MSFLKIASKEAKRPIAAATAGTIRIAVPQGGEIPTADVGRNRTATPDRLASLVTKAHTAILSLLFYYNDQKKSCFAIFILTTLVLHEKE